MTDEFALKEEHNGVPLVINKSVDTDQVKWTLIDDLVTRYSQIRQERTKRALAQLLQLARSFDLGNPHMSALFYETLHDLLSSGAEFDAGLRANLERLLGLCSKAEEPQVIEGGAIVVENE